MIRALFKLVVAVVVILVICFAAATVFIAVKGKDLATAKLQEVLHRKVSIEAIGVGFPLDIRITGVDIENLLKADEIYLSFGVIDLLKKNIELPALRLLRPQVTINRVELEGLVQQATAQRSQPQAVPAGKQSAAAVPVAIVLNKLTIQDGSVTFVDPTVGPKPFVLDAVNVDMAATRISFPLKPMTMQVQVSADVAAPAQGASFATVKAEGWLDWVKKDAQGAIEVANLDATRFYPYYQKYASQNLKSAAVNAKADVNARNNDMTVDCHLALRDLIFEQPGEQTLQNLNIMDIIGGSVAQTNKNIEFDFSFKTKLDNPKIDSAQIRGMVLNKVFQDAVSQPPEETIKKIENLKDTFKGIGDSFEDAFKGIFK